MAVWVVRGGTGGELEEDFLTNGCVAIGYDLFDDLNNVLTKQDLKSLLQQARGESHAKSIPSWTGQIWDFKDSINIGDLVVMPGKQKPTIAIGEMVGDYVYHLETPAAPHRRVVRWISQGISRDLLDPDLQKSMNAPGTVYQCQCDRAEDRLRVIAETVQDILMPTHNGTTALWDEFVRRAKEYISTGKLESDEIEYKVEINRKAATAREAVLDGADDWAALTKSCLGGNIIHFTQQDNFRRWLDASPGDALNALRAIWTRDDLSVSERARTFSSLFPRSVTSGPGTRMNVISVLLMGFDVEQYPPFRITLFVKAYDLTGYGRPEQGADEAALYEYALGFLDRFIKEAKERGLHLRHRLDAQSVAWMIQDPMTETLGPDDDGGDTTPTYTPDLQALAEKVYLPVGFLEEIEMLLKDKRQVIFQGPPGTGKTYVARKLAACLAGSGERVTLVQFHPSYAYEDFVQGFRPRASEGGQAGFELRDGPLLRAAERAREEQDADHFLVIDEINRGNVAKVFGELYFLLEYRDSKMNLQYSDKPFSLPRNLYIIGTMNTADRSIALVDMALRRRFYFKMFHPDDEPVKSVLRKWLAKKAPDMEWVADVVERANALLKDDRHAAIGPSYFMKPGLNEDAVRRIWEHSVLPYLEERLFGGDELAEEFVLDKLRRRADAPSVAQEDGESQAATAAEGQADGMNDASD